MERKLGVYRTSFAWYHGNPAAYAGVMEGKRIGTAVGIGSMVEIELGRTVYFCSYCQE